MAINEIICLPVFVCQYLFLLEICEDFVSRGIPSVIIMYITGILEEIVRRFWQNTFVPCVNKFESMQAIYVSYR